MIQDQLNKISSRRNDSTKYLIIYFFIIAIIIVSSCTNQNTKTTNLPKDIPEEIEFNYNGSCIPDQVQCGTCQPMHDKCFNEYSINKSCDKCCSGSYYSDYLGHKPCVCPKWAAECLCLGGFYCGSKQ